MKKNLLSIIVLIYLCFPSIFCAAQSRSVQLKSADLNPVRFIPFTLQSDAKDFKSTNMGMLIINEHDFQKYADKTFKIRFQNDSYYGVFHTTLYVFKAGQFSPYKNFREIRLDTLFKETSNVYFVMSNGRGLNSYKTPKPKS